MSLRTIPFAAVALAVLFALPDLAWASPVKQITALFDDIINLFTGKIIPGLCVAVIAWNGLMIATGRKTLMDCLVILVGAAVALTASLTVAYLSGAS